MNSDDKEAWLEKHGVIYAVEFNEEKHAFTGVWMSRSAICTIRRDGASRNEVSDKTHDAVKEHLFMQCRIHEGIRERLYEACLTVEGHNGSS